MLLHRTLLEYLAAEEVAQGPAPVPAAERFLWQPDAEGTLRWQPAAAEMLCFLAGCLDDPAPLLHKFLQLDRERQDLGRTMLLLAGEALGDVDESRVGPELAGAVTSDAFAVRRGDPGVTVRCLAHHRGIEVLAQAMSDPDAETRRRAAAALNLLGGEGATESLIQALASRTYSRSAGRACSRCRGWGSLAARRCPATRIPGRRRGGRRGPGGSSAVL
jgi:HEAT repeat protein